VVENWFAVRVAVNIAATLVVWVGVTLLTSRRPSAQTVAFYRKMRIAGPGWRRIAQETGHRPMAGELLRAATAWAGSLMLLFGLLLGIGSLIFHEWSAAAAYGVPVAVGALLLRRELRRLRPTFAGDRPEAQPPER